MAKNKERVVHFKQSPSLEDFDEKMINFNYERVIHEKEAIAHGEFILTKSLKKYTTAKLFQETNKKTPVFARFSTAIGSSNRDICSFATKFYTEEGVFDLVGQNLPIFYINDAFKFLDLIDALKEKQSNVMTAHDTFWDFVRKNEETAHMIMWLMSSRSLPRSYRMIEGFGMHTFSMENERGEKTYVKFHWKPKLGVHSLSVDEARSINGVNPNFYRYDLYEAIERKDFPQFELGVQLLEESRRHLLNFDIFDVTKLWPEDIVPVQQIGVLTLNKNASNRFIENEQVVIHPKNIIDGIDFSTEPLLRDKLFSFTSLQINRFQSSNLHELLINESHLPFYNNKQVSFMRQMIHSDKMNEGNLVGGNIPVQKKKREIIVRRFTNNDFAKSSNDHFEQARLFWNSLSMVEKEQIIQSFTYELAQVQKTYIRKSIVEMFCNVSFVLANEIAKTLGIQSFKYRQNLLSKKRSFYLSQFNTNFTAKTRRVAILVDQHFSYDEATMLLTHLEKERIYPTVISDTLGKRMSHSKEYTLTIDKTFLNAPAALFDGLYILSSQNINKAFSKYTLNFVKEMFKQYKPIAIYKKNRYWLQYFDYLNQPGVFVAEKIDDTFIQKFLNGLAKHRFWERKFIDESLS